MHKSSFNCAYVGNTDIREACTGILNTILPKSTWVLGRTTVFAKDGSSRRLHEWLIAQASRIIHPWIEKVILENCLKTFAYAVNTLQHQWRKKLLQIKYKKLGSNCILIQTLTRCILANNRIIQQRSMLSSHKSILQAWYNYRVYQDYISLIQDYRNRKVRINLQILRKSVLSLVVRQKFGKKIKAWIQQIRKIHTVQTFARYE